MLNTDGKFYLGRHIDPATDETSDQPLFYDPDDLTTHAVVVGMTGSGKTGLCIDLLEEAALNNIPALMIDPKGDITNTLLHFPELLPSDFIPWINAIEARRDGKTVAQAAADTAALWRNGLGKWDITPERIQALKDGPRFSVYTPGSDAGLPVSILASLAAPEIPWSGNEEMLREKISSTVTALLGLTGLTDIDPVRSREHILLANIFEHAWSQGQDLSLGELIMQTQTPPFEKLGFFDIGTFFPDKDRFELAMLLNNIMAAPSFQSWIKGEPLDVGKMLYDADGRARHTIFYIAHLNDTERMFFVTLLYSAVESWMRTQSGTSSLRALVYFDEIFGYLPPVGNPPSKEPMLRLLKQARAFGVGMVLASQNPVDIDYKALSNAGTWFVGKLGTEQDKARLLDGLSSAAGAGLDRKEYDDLISALGKRAFLLRNVHEPHPVIFRTRWAMNYLAGPVTRSQIPALNELAGSAVVSEQLSVGGKQASVRGKPSSASTQSSAHDPEPLELPGTASKPAVPRNVSEYFLPNSLTLSAAARHEGVRLPKSAKSQGLIYRPVLLAQANVRFLNRKYSLDHEVQHSFLIHEPDRRGVVRWESEEETASTSSRGLSPRAIDRHPAPESRFASLEAPFSDGRVMKAMQTDFVDWIYRNTETAVKANETLKLYAGPDVSQDDFEEICLEAARDKQELEVDKLEARYKKKIAAVEKRLQREERELREDEADLARRKREEMTSHAETLFGLFSKRRRTLSKSMTKRRMTARAKEDVEESLEEIEAFKREIKNLQTEMEDSLDDVEEKWREIALDTTEISVTPYKKDIQIDLFGLAWLPYHLVQVGDDVEEIVGFAGGD